MNAIKYQQRIDELQQRRHVLLARREQRGAPVIGIDMELNVVRSELQALYALHRHQKPANQTSNRKHDLQSA
jgi:hypothetical protein